MDPQQELFTQLKLDIEALAYDVYDGFLPPDGTPYPFIYLGESQLIDDENKTAVFGTVYQTVHVWHNTPMERGTVSLMLLAIKQAARSISRTDNFTWQVRGLTQRILEDNTTRQPLLHGVVDIEFYFS
jgi:hypothetical protein